MPTPDTFVVAPATAPTTIGVAKVPVLKSGTSTGGTGSGSPSPTTGQIWPL